MAFLRLEYNGSVQDGLTGLAAWGGQARSEPDLQGCAHGRRMAAAACLPERLVRFRERRNARVSAAVSEHQGGRNAGGDAEVSGNRCTGEILLRRFFPMTVTASSKIALAWRHSLF